MLYTYMDTDLESSQFCVCYLSGVGGIEAEAVMLGQAISMVLPKVVGYKITGKIGPLATSTDVVLTITKVQCTHKLPILSVPNPIKLSAAWLRTNGTPIIDSFKIDHPFIIITF